MLQRTYLRTRTMPNVSPTWAIKTICWSSDSRIGGSQEVSQAPPMPLIILGIEYA